MRVAVLHNSDLAPVWREVERGRVPRHLVYGIDRLAARGDEVRVVPYQGSAALKRAGQALQRTRLPLGDLDQERSAMRSADWADVIYAPSQNAVPGLGLLRAAGLLATPVVAIIHHPIDDGRLGRLRRPLVRKLLDGYDAYPALSRPVAADLARRAGSADRTEVLPWGPDLDFYPPSEPGGGSGAIAVGSMSRDFDTLALSASRARVATRIVCTPERAPRVPVAGCVTVQVQRDGWGIGWPALLEAYAAARVVAIPLALPRAAPLRGLTGLLDALAMGRPVVMTRHPGLDLDPERDGFGFVVAEGDVEGWARALRILEDDAELAARMGRRARSIVEGGLHVEAFGDRLLAILDRVAGAGRGARG